MNASKLEPRHPRKHDKIHNNEVNGNTGNILSIFNYQFNFYL